MLQQRVADLAKLVEPDRVHRQGIQRSGYL